MERLSCRFHRSVRRVRNTEQHRYSLQGTVRGIQTKQRRNRYSVAIMFNMTSILNLQTIGKSLIVVNTLLRALVPFEMSSELWLLFK